ncbi:hypothetical protein [Aureimonas pseudogalii]|uniref:Uncharacterized protein n=1 Tax=Aureimonas pseudogalii TaxID=1744844 RepID=A0A7W6EGH2_9HYPH|nr:hypothetical protein [Aureimonas pseudogalii]MBB3997858.1 hypothetical protein [Aureimonas pseudogalii]
MIPLEDQLRSAELRLAAAQHELVLKLAWQRQDWSSYVMAHPLAGQLGALVRVLEHHGALRLDPDATLSTALPDGLSIMLRNIWSAAGQSDHAMTWAWVLRVLRNSGQPLGRHADQVRYAALPDLVTIYRGFTSGADDAESYARGFSWTTDRSIAMRSAHPTSAPLRSFVATTTVPKSTILACLVTAGEDEIVIDRPEELRWIALEEIDHVLLRRERLSTTPAGAQADWPTYIRSASNRLDAALLVLEHHGAVSFDPDAKLTTTLPPELLGALHTEWLLTGNHHDARKWSWILQVLRSSGQSLTPDECREIYRDLPDQITLHRGFGCHPAAVETCTRGFSWSPDRCVAQSFAIALAGVSATWLPYLATAVVSKAAIHSVVMRAEFVIDRPGELRDFAVQPVCTAKAVEWTPFRRTGGCWV